MEAGQTTTEFWGKCILQLVTALFAVAGAFGHGLGADQQIAILGVAGTLITVAEGSYALSRGIRKVGTP
jgi:hypothetical protein